MSKDIRESLSALMDGEASELEVRRLLREDSEELSEVWSRFHRQQAVLHNERSFAELDVSSAVRSALVDEQPHRKNVLRDWRRPLGGLAVAASVAALVVFGLGGNSPSGVQLTSTQQTTEQGGRVYLSAPTASATGTVNASAASTEAPRFQAVNDEQSRQRFERLLQQHTERAAVNSGQGMVAYARLSSHGTQ
ncbi:MAG: sigma-E factor negative regulatory protein RseA [Paracoccaceae bacterium]|jgi:sigma-E factor negative regulatory protein RseA